MSNGKSTVEVAQILNVEGIPTPSANKAGTPSAHANWAGDNFWRLQTVSWIIRDRQYIGSIVWGKRVRDKIGVHQQVKASIDDWIIVDDRHDPIVTKELFQKAQIQLGGEFKQTTKYTLNDYPLHRKVYCGVCGMAIVRAAKKAPYYRCKTPSSLPDAGCYREKVYEDEILDAVTEAIRIQARYAVEVEHIIVARQKQDAVRIKSLQAELHTLQGLQEKIKEQTQRLYEGFVEGQLKRETYITQKTALQRRSEEILNKAESATQHISAANTNDNLFVESYSKYTELDNLTSEIATDLLDRVTVWPDGRLDISLNYLDEFANIC